MEHRLHGHDGPDTTRLVRNLLVFALFHSQLACAFVFVAFFLRFHLLQVANVRKR